MLRPPKQKLKESAKAKFVPSAAIFAILLLVADGQYRLTQPVMATVHPEQLATNVALSKCPVHYEHFPPMLNRIVLPFY